MNIQIPPLDQKAMSLAKKRIDSLVKPYESLGDMEQYIEKLAGIQATDQPSIDSRYHIVMCADNGVFCEDVSRSEQKVTRQVAENFQKGATCASVFARKTRSTMLVYDVGIDWDQPLDGVISRKVRRSTANMKKGPAMTRNDAKKAILVGIDAARKVKREGGQIITTGEMGVCNTTTSAALASVFLGLDPSQTVGRGAGLTHKAYLHKIEVVRSAIEANQPDRSDVLDVLSKLGGLDICGLTGVFLGAAQNRLPVIADGLISTVALLAASLMEPKTVEYAFASHISAEPAGQAVLDKLGLKAPIQMGMRVGEGTGALLFLEILDFALKAYYEMPTFDQAEIMVYDPLE